MAELPDEMMKDGAKESITEAVRVAVAGPVAPFRSGVARHTTELCAALAMSGLASVSVYSFRRQYPRRLFPGQDDRAPDGQPPSEIDVEYALDSLNPLTWYRTARRIKQTGAGILVMPAWTFFLAPCLGFIARYCRRAGIRVLMVVHNVVDHEESRWKSWLSRFQLRQAGHFITHGEALAAQLRKIASETPVTVRPHPIFEHYPDPKGELPRRAPLELLFFGLVRRYKGLDVALEGLAAAGRRDIRLTVAGEFWEGLAATRELIRALGLEAQVELVPRFVSDAEAAEYFSRADAVVLPYRSVSGSGVVPVAYRYGKPVIVSDLPGLTEVVEDRHTGWVVREGDSKAIGRLLSGEVTADSARSMQGAIARLRSEMSWERFAEAVFLAAGDP